jgi:hypothetical protein
MKQKWKNPRKSKVNKAKAVVAQAVVASGKNTIIRQMVKRVVSGIAETKHVTWYSGDTNNGAFSGNGYGNQNSKITSNATDIKRLIPYVAQGISDNQRIGEKIRPVSFIVNGSVRLNDGTINQLDAQFRDDVVVVMYVLQHVSLKDYGNLVKGNDFTQLLRTGENTTVPFQGLVAESQMPVEDAYYRLLKKQKIRLRYAGAKPASVTGVPQNMYVSNTDSYYADFSMNLTKHLPAQLKYPEGNAPVPTLNDPTNSSIFLCLGFYNMDGTTTIDGDIISLQYTAQLKFKDM